MQLEAGEPLDLVGSVLSVLEGVVVVQGLANSAALTEGCALSLCSALLLPSRDAAVAEFEFTSPHLAPRACRSVLVLDDARVPLGRVEEVFGPVMQPFYVLRWAGAGAPPSELQLGARVSTAPRLATRVAAEQLVRGAIGTWRVHVCITERGSSITRARGVGSCVVRAQAVQERPIDYDPEQEGAPGEQEDVYFSDDEEEAAYL